MPYTLLVEHHTAGNREIGFNSQLWRHHSGTRTHSSSDNARSGCNSLWTVWAGGTIARSDFDVRGAPPAQPAGKDSDGNCAPRAGADSGQVSERRLCRWNEGLKRDAMIDLRTVRRC